MEKGYIQIYTGEGKGKTTASLGVVLRSLGEGLKVAMAQFVKSPDFKYNEMKALEWLKNCKECQGEFVVRQFGKGCCCHGEPSNADFEGAERALNQAKEWIMSGEYDIVILDEVNIALHLKLIPLEKVVELLENKPESVEVILTGRHAPEELYEMADLVTEMKEIKHYFRKGVLARAGIEK